MNTKHTPTPWCLGNHGGIFTHDLRFMVADTSGLDVVVSNMEELANAAFIVRACNAHDDLVAALYAGLRHWHDTAGYPRKEPKWLAPARAALAKAKGE